MRSSAGHAFEGIRFRCSAAAFLFGPSPEPRSMRARFLTRVGHPAFSVRTIVKMKVIKSRRAPAAAIGAADISVMQAAYSLAKAQSEPAAREILRDIPAATYPALAKHMRERPSLFLPAVYDVVVQAIDGRKLSKADALFS